MDMEMSALTAPAAMTTVIIEPENRSRMMVSLCLRLPSLQRIWIAVRDFYAVPACRIRTSSLRKGELFEASSMQQPREAIVSFDAARLIINSVRLVALPGELLLGGPWPCPHCRIFDGHGVFERGWPGARPALDQVQVLARALIIGLRTEVRYVDDEGIALPVATRIAVPLADAGGQVRTPVHDDVALPPLPLTHVVEDRDAAWCLHDSPEADVAKLGQPPGQAALRQRGVLRTIVAIHARGVVARREFRESRRLRRIVLASVTRRLLVFARQGRLQQGNTQFPFRGGHLLSLCRQRR